MFININLKTIKAAVVVFMVIKMILIMMVMMMVVMVIPSYQPRPSVRMRREPIKAGVVVFVVIMIRMIVMMVVTVLMLPWKMSNLDEAASANHENEEGDDEGGRARESNPSLGRTQVPNVGNHHQDPKYLFER